MPGEPRRDDAVQLLDGAAVLGVALDAEQISSLLRYLELLYAWNRAARLTTVPRGDAVRLHLLDSLAIVPFIPSPSSIADLGSGAGLPGIPLAVALPECRVALVESKPRKCSFLAETVRELVLTNCKVIEADVSTLSAGEERYGTVTARAFLPPAQLVETAIGLLAPRGQIVVMGARRDDELGAVARADLVLGTDRRIRLPGGNELRRVLVLRKVEAS